MKLIHKILPLLSAFFLGIIATTGIVQLAMAHGGDSNLIHTCVKTSNGSIKVVGVNDTCGSGETPLDWSRKGINAISGFNTTQLIGYTPSPSNFDFRYLDGVNFTNSTWNSISVKSATFTNTNFTGAVFDQSDFSATDFSNSIFINSRITTSPLNDSNFTNVNFTGATLEDLSGSGIVLVNNTNFTGSNFTNAILTGVTFTSSTRTGVTWSNTTCPDGTNSDSHSNTCEGHLTP